MIIEGRIGGLSRNFNTAMAQHGKKLATK